MLLSAELHENGVRLLDQRKLPLSKEFVECQYYHEVGEAIRTLTVRGAPAIGIAAAYGLVLAARAARKMDRPAFDREMYAAADELRGTRPTAVNLFWAINRMMRVLDENPKQPVNEMVALLEREARAIFTEDVEMNKRIGHYGRDLVKDGARILTHCNAGAIATGGYGTALGIIRAAAEQGKQVSVWVDETRPLLQGARLTAWELMEDGIPVTLITDNMAGHFMQRGMVDIVLLGADRITANGDVANKIGTYSVAVLAKEHGIPFYVVAPTSTIDMSIDHGREIVIEERNPDEVTSFSGVRTAPEGVKVANPAFDVTPHRYITGIITDNGVVYPPFDVNLKRLKVMINARPEIRPE
ncbi:MAG: S-methyl-5-thioribose-1-phosphate isomerase [Bacillota bacterium]